MTRSPTDTLRAYFASFRDADWREQIPPLFTEDAEYLNFATEPLSPETKNAIPWAGIWRGHDEIIAFQTLLNDNFEVRGFDDHIFTEQDDHVAVFGQLLFTAKPTGKPADSDFAAQARIVDGRIASYHFYEDTFAIANAFRTDGHWSVENKGVEQRVRKVPDEGDKK